MTAIAIVLLVACMCIVSACVGVLVVTDLRRARRERTELVEVRAGEPALLAGWERKLNIRPQPGQSLEFRRGAVQGMLRLMGPLNEEIVSATDALSAPGEHLPALLSSASPDQVRAISGLLDVTDPERSVPSSSMSSSSWERPAIHCAVALLLATGCGPSSIASSGGETGETGGELPMPGTEVVCVDMTPDSTTCWVAWEAGVSAQVLLECQAADRVSAGDWTPAYEDEIPGWGLVLCHDDIGGAGTRCLFDAGRVLLTEGAGGWWEPGLSAVAALYDPVDPPCGFSSDLLCGTDICTEGYGCTIAATCVDCAFVVGVYGCACNIDGECESSSVCVDGVCSDY